MNYLLDNNIIIDILSERRKEKYPESLKVYNLIQNSQDNIFISSSSLDNIEFILFKEIKAQFSYNNKEALNEVHNRIKQFIKNIKIAKTPSYIKLDYEDIEDSQIIASAKAIDAKIVTRDEKLLQNYSEITITPSTLLPPITNIQIYQYTNTPTIDFANLKKQYFKYQNEIEKEIDKVLNSAKYIMGPQIQELEKKLCEFTGAKEAITCSSGTDALLLAIMALDIKPSDEVITTPFTFIATAETIAFLGAKPVFVDINEKTYNIDVTKIEEKITPKTKAIIAVSLYGQPCDLDEINYIINQQLKTKNQKLHLIIDGAQSFGATYKGKAEVHYCDIYTTSFFPAKPLGCFGDGGAVLTNNSELAEKIRMLRVHGQNKRYHHKYIGLGARMDTIQAAIVNVKLKYYKKDLALRQEVAQKYTERLKAERRSQKDNKWIEISPSTFILLPSTLLDRTSAFAQYSIRVKGEGRREKVQSKLKEQGIPTAVHYPMPLHLQECFRYLGYKKGDFPVAESVSQEIMSLPMNPDLSDEEVETIVRCMQEIDEL
jgi:UDP-2-acetamido-2-deoxy-ribo-hexuluronate aminotransferase